MTTPTRRHPGCRCENDKVRNRDRGPSTASRPESASMRSASLKRSARDHHASRCEWTREVVVDAVHRARRKKQEDPAQVRGMPSLDKRSRVTNEADSPGRAGIGRARRAHDKNLAAGQEGGTPRLDAGERVRLLHSDVELVARQSSARRPGTDTGKDMLACRHITIFSAA